MKHIFNQQKRLEDFSEDEVEEDQFEVTLFSRQHHDSVATKYKNFFDLIPQIICRINNFGSVEYLNRFWTSYTGTTIQDGLEQGWHRIVHPRDLLKIERQWNLAQQSKSEVEIECRLLARETQKFRWNRLKIIPEMSGTSSIFSWFGFVFDIDESKKNYKNLRQVQKTAELTADIKSRFLANISHEIRTPLGIIIGFSELLVDPKTTQDEKNQVKSVIHRNGNILSNMIDEILDVSRMESGLFNLKFENVIVSYLLSDIKNSMLLQARDKKLKFEFCILGRVPAQINSNASRFRQILTHVIGNAIKFSSNGLVKVCVSFQEGREGEKSYLCITVLDSGPGLTAKQIECIFKPFTQVDTSMTRKHGGVGMGLAFSQKLARALGGDIFVQSNGANQGSQFLIKIHTGLVDLENYLDQEKFNIEDASRLGQVLAQNLILKGAKILLVEDAIDNQILVSRFLSFEGAQVDLANNGLDGLQKVDQGDYDLIIMDIQMPELDGYQTVRKLRRVGFSKPILALTAHSLDGEREKCLEFGFDDYMTKPVHRSQLIERVHYFLNLDRQNTEDLNRTWSLL